MANQLSVTVLGINGNPLPSSITLSRPTKDILVQDGTVAQVPLASSTLIYYPNPLNALLQQTFQVDETVAELETLANTSGTSMFEATVLTIGQAPQKQALDMLFPCDKPSIWPNVSGSINSYVQFKGVAYYCSETASTLITAANAGGSGGGVESVTAGANGGLLFGGTETNPTISLPYKVYTALLTQSGEDAPVATVLQNTLGGEVVWTRSDPGQYSGILAGAFTLDKTYIPGFGNFYDLGAPVMPIWDGSAICGYYYIGPAGNPDRFVMTTMNESFVATDLSQIIGTSGANIHLPKIEVYP
jgi:hypothetical protein